MSYRRVFVTVTIVALSLTATADATRTRALGLSDLVAEADVVVRGRVLSQGATWDARRQRIYTDSVILVDSVLKGANTIATPSIEVRQLGGTMNNVAQFVDGVGQLKLGQDVLLFLKSDGRFHYVAGMAQGRFIIVKQGGVELAHRNVDGLQLVGKAQFENSTAKSLPPVYTTLETRVRALTGRK